MKLADATVRKVDGTVREMLENADVCSFSGNL